MIKFHTHIEHSNRAKEKPPGPIQIVAHMATLGLLGSYLLFCNGPWCDQSPRAIADLLKAGYPAEKIRYYRGGMQLWLMLGFNTVADAANKS